MKRLILTLCACLGIAMSWAQVEARYDKGNVPVVNGRVYFETTIPTLLSKATAYERLDEWAKQRFNKPNVIVSKFITNDATNYTIGLTAEEYLVFTKKFFTLDRTRINYWVEIQCADGNATLKFTRINYWYEEEREGGIKFSAEEFITDEQAFNRKGDNLLKDQGKFRRGTIDFFDSIVADLTAELSGPTHQLDTDIATATSAETETVELPVQIVDTTILIADNNSNIEETALTEQEEKVQYPIVYFAFNSTQLAESEYYKIQEIADKMKANNSISIRITGWCDPIGSQDVNRRISLLRAKTIMNALEMLQIPTERIEIVGGGIKHDAPNNTEARITTIEEIYHK